MNSTSPGREARQQRGEVAGVLDRRAARQPQRPAALVRDDHRERRLAEARRAGEQDVVGRALLDARGVEQQLQLAAHLLLADELRERGRPQRALDRELGLVEPGSSASSAGHPPTGSLRAGPSAASVRRSSAGTDAGLRRRRRAIDGLDGLGRDALGPAEADERLRRPARPTPRRRHPRRRAAARGASILPASCDRR